MSKPKPVNWQLIEDNDLYEFVKDLIEQYHGGDSGLDAVNFVLMWRHNIKMDQDNYIQLADVSKSPDKVRELMPHDFIIGINKEVWGILEPQHKMAIIDAQLERIAPCYDKEDNHKEDDRARPIYRLRRQEVIDEATLKRRHGVNMLDVQEFVYEQFKTAGAEEGSYVAEQLANKPELKIADSGLTAELTNVEAETQENR